MNINRNNYEEFFMLYADNELDAAERKAVEAFVAANPDLQEELASIGQFKLTPDEAIVFAGKESLIKNGANSEAISLLNYENFFVLYADEELSNTEKAAVETFVYHQPQLQESFELLQLVKLSPDAGIVFENKKSLCRKEEDDRVIPFGWWKIAVAAMVLLIAGILWIYQANKTSTLVSIVKNGQSVTNPQQQPLYKKQEHKIDTTNSNPQPIKENALANTVQKEKQAVKNIQAPQGLAVKNKLPVQQGLTKITEELGDVTEPLLAEAADKPLKGTAVAALNSSEDKDASINTGIAAAASRSVLNQQLVYRNTAGDESKSIAEQVVAVNNDKLEVLNTSVDTKNTLRGFFRKASRMMGKKNNPEEDDSKHKSILIGGFEIAVR